MLQCTAGVRMSSCALHGSAGDGRGIRHGPTSVMARGGACALGPSLFWEIPDNFDSGVCFPHLPSRISEFKFMLYNNY